MFVIVWAHRPYFFRCDTAGLEYRAKRHAFACDWHSGSYDAEGFARAEADAYANGVEFTERQIPDAWRS